MRATLAVSTLIGLLLMVIGWLSLFFCVGCGKRVAIVEPSSAACIQAVRCGVFSPHEFARCVQCVDNSDPLRVHQLRREWGGLPPLDQVDCSTLEAVCSEMTVVA